MRWQWNESRDWDWDRCVWRHMSSSLPWMLQLLLMMMMMMWTLISWPVIMSNACIRRWQVYSLYARSLTQCVSYRISRQHDNVTPRPLQHKVSIADSWVFWSCQLSIYPISRNEFLLEMQRSDGLQLTGLHCPFQLDADHFSGRERG